MVRRRGKNHFSAWLFETSHSFACNSSRRSHAGNPTFIPSQVHFGGDKQQFAAFKPPSLLAIFRFTQLNWAWRKCGVPREMDRQLTKLKPCSAYFFLRALYLVDCFFSSICERIVGFLFVARNMPGNERNFFKNKKKCWDKYVVFFLSLGREAPKS